MFIAICCLLCLFYSTTIEEYAVHNPDLVGYIPGNKTYALLINDPMLMIMASRNQIGGDLLSASDHTLNASNNGFALRQSGRRRRNIIHIFSFAMPRIPEANKYFTHTRSMDEYNAQVAELKLMKDAKRSPAEIEAQADRNTRAARLATSRLATAASRKRGRRSNGEDGMSNGSDSQGEDGELEEDDSMVGDAVQQNRLSESAGTQELMADIFKETDSDDDARDDSEANTNSVGKKRTFTKAELETLLEDVKIKAIAESLELHSKKQALAVASYNKEQAERQLWQNEEIKRHKQEVDDIHAKYREAALKSQEAYNKRMKEAIDNGDWDAIRKTFGYSLPVDKPDVTSASHSFSSSCSSSSPGEIVVSTSTVTAISLQMQLDSASEELKLSTNPSLKKQILADDYVLSLVDDVDESKAGDDSPVRIDIPAAKLKARKGYSSAQGVTRRT